MWIVKPGEDSNQGHDIQVTNSTSKISEILQSSTSEQAKRPNKRTYVIQKYIENPLLIHRRKFDIRVFALFTSFNGYAQGYFYKDGYLRTACKDYTTRSGDKFIHLTNDAV